MFLYLDCHLQTEQRKPYKRMPEFWTGKESYNSLLATNPRAAKRKEGRRATLERQKIYKGIDGLKNYLSEELSGKSDLEIGI